MRANSSGLLRTTSLEQFQSLDIPGLYSWLPIGPQEPNLAKVGVEGSNPFARSRFALSGPDT